jgi:signal transduction histidine kinase
MSLPDRLQSTLTPPRSQGSDYAQGSGLNTLIVSSFVLMAIAGVFIVDLNLPLGIAIWLLYIPPLLLSLWKLQPATTCFLTGLCTVLILLAFFMITAAGKDPQLVLLNRSLAIGMLWLTVFLGLRYRRALEKIESLAADLAARAGELEAANRELGAFNYTVSHDLRRPLTGIIGYCEIMLEQCIEPLAAPCREDLRKIYVSAMKMNRLIDTLLEFSLITEYSVSREPVDLSAMAREIAGHLREYHPGRSTTFAIADGITVPADGRLMRIVLENLLGNAWKYTSRKSDAIIEFGVTASKGKPVCFVRDNGVGFDMRNADRLFAAFQRLHGEYEGSGIGLATVKRIIDRHGGILWAEGEEGKGAVFYFSL